MVQVSQPHLQSTAPVVQVSTPATAPVPSPAPVTAAKPDSTVQIPDELQRKLGDMFSGRPGVHLDMKDFLPMLEAMFNDMGLGEFFQTMKTNYIKREAEHAVDKAGHAAGLMLGVGANVATLGMVSPVAVDGALSKIANHTGLAAAAHKAASSSATFFSNFATNVDHITPQAMAQLHAQAQLPART